MFREFRNFINRGNVLDLAVAVVIGAAFGGVVNSLVKDILMPPIGLLLGKVDFSNMFIILSGQGAGTLAEAQKAGAVTLNYGLFLNGIINFLIIGFAVFLIVRQANRFQKPVEASTKDCPYCKSAIHLQATRCPHCTSEVGS